MKSFDDLKKEIGNGLALVIYFPKLTDQHKNSLTLTDWAEIFKESPLESDVSEIAFGQLKGTPASVEEMAKVYEKNHGSERGKKVTAILANRLNNSSAEPNEWLKVFRLFATSVEVPHAIALRKIRKFNLDFGWWQEAFSIENLRVISLEEMEKKAKGFADWVAILTCAKRLDCSYKVYSDLKERLESLSIEKIIGLAETFEDWFQVFETISSEMKEHQNTAIKHMLGLAKTFGHWVAIYMIARGRRGVKNDDLKEEALRNIRELPTSFDNCLKAFKEANVGRTDKEITPALWRNIRNNNKLTLDQWLQSRRIAYYAEDEDTCELRICQMAYSFDDWKKVADDASWCADRGIGQKAIEKMICLAESADEWLIILWRTRHNEKYLTITLKKLWELL